MGVININVLKEYFLFFKGFQEIDLKEILRIHFSKMFPYSYLHILKKKTVKLKVI